MIIADFSSGDAVVRTEGLFQWDLGQQLKIIGLSEVTNVSQVHFANNRMRQAIVKRGTYENGALTVDIPNEFLQYGGPIPGRAWVYIYRSDTVGYTVKTVHIPIIERSRPNDYVSPTDPDSQGIVKAAMELLENYQTDLDGKLDDAAGSVENENIHDDAVTEAKLAAALRTKINAKEEKSNKKTTLTGNESSNDYYPTTKAVADALNTKVSSLSNRLALHISVGFNANGVPVKFVGGTTISSGAFTNSDVTKIFISQDVQTISNGAFAGCPALSDIYFDSTSTSYDNSTIPSGVTAHTLDNYHVMNCILDCVKYLDDNKDVIAEEVGELKSALDEIWIHTKYTNSSGADSQKNVQISGKSGQTLRIVNGSGAVNVQTRATKSGSTIQEIYVSANKTKELTITTDFEWLHLYYSGNSITDFYITDAIITKALDDIINIEGDITNIEGDITNIEGDITANLMGVDVQENIYPGAANWSGTWLNSDPAHVAVSNEKYMGYPTVYSSQSWRRFAKNIPVIAGKTYTFEGWIKQSVAGSVIAYIVTDEFTTDKATVSQNSKQLNDQPANTWIKVSLTFACTVSGNVSPHILGMHGAFLVAKYLLVEGDTVFSLSETLNDKAAKQDVSGVGDYRKYSFVGGVVGQYWNEEIQKTIAAGTKVRLIFDTYTGSKLQWVRIDGKKSDGTYTNNITGSSIQAPFIKGKYTEAITTENYVALRIQFARTEREDNVSTSIYLETTGELGLANDMMGMNVQRVFHINKDGSGDYTSFVEGVNAACGYMDSIVYVGAGTYDLLDELGSDYIKQAGVGERKGLELKNRVHVICSSQTILSMSNLRSLYDSDEQYDNAKEYLSPINTGVYGCTLENATIIDSNVRYSIHDDQGWSGSTPYINKFINCTLIHKSGMYGDCIGGGLGENCGIEIRGCYLEGESNVVRLAYYHGNNHTGVTTAKGRVTICDNYFAGVGTFQMTNYGDSTETSTAYVSNNSFGTAPSVRNAGTTVDMKAWNNEIRSN